MECYITDFKCYICNKYYKSINSLGNHNRKFHSQKTPKNAFVPPNNANIPPNNAKNVLKKSTSIHIIYKCEFCNKSFARKDNLQKHINLNRCKKKNDIIFSLKKENEELKMNFQKEITELKAQIKELMNKNCKIHYKTLQKINTQNNIQNNNINIIGFNKENLLDLFSDKEKLKILKKKYDSLNYFIEYAHFNNKYPQLKNIKITNLKDNIAYKYDDSKNKFIATTKDDLINDLVISRMTDIDEFQTEIYDKLSKKEQDIIKNMLDEFYNDEDKYKDKKKEDIKFIIYNNSEHSN
jgi:hypothetical protein